MSQTPSPYCNTISTAYQSIGSVSTYVDANIPRLGDPVGWNASSEDGGESVDITSCSSAVVVHVASETRLVQRVANQEHGLDGIEGGSSEHGEGVDGSCSSLGVAFEDKAFAGVRGKC